MRDYKKFWNRYSWLYDFEINRFNKEAYEEMYNLMSEVLRADMRVLEVATGTGLIALGIAKFVRQVEATDFSPKMIETAKKKIAPSNVKFSIEDAAALSFANDSFDAVIISNALQYYAKPRSSACKYPQGIETWWITDRTDLFTWAPKKLYLESERQNTETHRV